MLLSYITKNLGLLHNIQVYSFARARSSPTKQKLDRKQYQFENLQNQQANQFFEKYHQEVQKESVIKNFRRQLFTKTNKQLELEKLQQKLTKENKILEKMLAHDEKKGGKKYSKKIMQHFLNKRSIFKGNQSINVFKDYADYSAYKDNYVSIEDRNYLDMDHLNRDSSESKTYEFIDQLPDYYEQKRQVRSNMDSYYPNTTQNLSISQYGKFLQEKHQNAERYNQIISEQAHENHFKIIRNDQDCGDLSRVRRSVNSDINNMQPFQLSLLSTQAMNKIYDLYVQGWSVRQISRRFGILPARAKFHIWARARFFHQILPKHGLKYFFTCVSREQELLLQHSVMDYGMDLDDMTMSDKYQQITGWQSKRVDSQRTPQQYTSALEKLQKHKKFGKYDMLEIGTYGKQNKKYSLKQWKIYRGKKSDNHFLKNKIFRRFMEENQKTRKVYY